LRLQGGAHLAGQALDRTEAEHVRRVPRVGTARALAVAAQERDLGLRPGAVGSALGVAAEAPERVGAPGRAALHATQARRPVDRVAVGLGAPAVLRPERIAEELVADDEERVDAEGAAVEHAVGEGSVLDQLSRIARVEHAVERLATAEVDGSLELLQEDGVVGDRRGVGRKRVGRRRRCGLGMWAWDAGDDGKRRHEGQRNDGTRPRGRWMVAEARHGSDT